MKILSIDDQKLVLIPLENRLKKIGYDVVTATSVSEGINQFENFNPDLVIVDINMPEASGIDLVKYIREEKKLNTPIMILSGNTSNEIISKAFELGVDDYMKKPLSLNEVYLRTKRLIGAPNKIINRKKFKNRIIEKRCVGVVIPCYNEEKRLLSNEFLSFIEKHSGYHLCFVNDGSTDNTLNALKDLRKGKEDYITVYNCKNNGGKAEAVRKGMLYMSKFQDLDYIGFLDADLSTDLADFDGLVTTIENSNYKIVSGSRIERMGANISKESGRKIISLSINYFIRKILSLDFNDTQCGAKIFHKDIIKVSFKDKFITKWIFDVEIFKRIINEFGLKKAKKILCEKPLKRWIHVDDSKLSIKDSLKIIFQLIQISWSYRRKKIIKKTTKIKSEVNNDVLLT